MKTFTRRYVPLLVAACFGGASAAPTLPQVVAGQASFSQQGNVFSITNTPGTIINWQSFSVNPGEVTRFIQQSADSAVLNRILGQDPTKILGALQSNGKVFLINPNGILFGRDARVDVNGLVASTLNISNADFLAGKKNFTAGPGAGDVRNEGAITTPSGGQVFLVAPNVGNTGIITSPKGEVVLAAGHSVQLVDSRDPNMQVVISAPASQAINLGQVVAQGGKIGIYGALVNQRGQVNANSAVVGENGKIVLKATRDTVLEHGSVTSATGAGKGGEINLVGERVGLAGNAAVDASGAAGGGTVLVGGDWQGKNPLIPNARQAWFGKDATIKADALLNGDGGKVVLWADGATSAFGSISAHGGALGGNGGMVETSGHDLDITGATVNAGAARGKTGTWLLDPFDIVVASDGAASAEEVALFESGSSSGATRISAATLGTSANIVLQATNDITIEESVSTSGSVTALAGRDITVNAGVTSTGGDISFTAHRNFTLGAGATLTGRNYIDLRADNMFLDGTINGIGSALPVVSFTSYDPARPIEVRDGSPDDDSVLWLDAAALKRFNAYQISLGNSSHTGNVSIHTDFTKGANLVIDNAGSIGIYATVILTGTSSNFVASLYGDTSTAISIADGGSVKAGKSVLLQGDKLGLAGTVEAPSVTLMPHNPGTPIYLGAPGEGHHFGLLAEDIDLVTTANLTIGGLPGHFGAIHVNGLLDFLESPNAPAKLTLDAGDAELDILEPVRTPNTLVLKSTYAIHVEDGGVVEAGKLGIKGGYVSLMGDNKIGELAGTTNEGLFKVEDADGFVVGTVDGMSGIDAPSASIELIAHDGTVTVDKPIDGGDHHVSITADAIRGTAKVKGSSVSLFTHTGIGTASAPLNTETEVLIADNHGGGDHPINIRNQGDLVVANATQTRHVEDFENEGAITISTTGKLEVLPAEVPHEEETPDLPGRVNTESGNISLTGNNGLLVAGEVTSTKGDIRLEAANGSKFTTIAGARVEALAGETTVVAGSTEIAANTLRGKYSLQGPTPPGGGATPPNVDQCLNDPSRNGCGPVLENAVRACIANPSAPGCEKVMPKPNECKANPQALGCDVVLERDKVLQCSLNPGAPGCEGAYNICVAKPATPGCGPIVEQRAKLDACIANPKGNGCRDILPKFEQCNTNPALLGCAPVIEERQKVQACVINPKGANCRDILPPLEQCHVNPNEFGCTPVLQREKFDVCLVNPNGPGCDDILPPVNLCKVNPAEEGCTQVINKTFDMCLVNPHNAVCEGVLPPLSECVSEPGKRGCTAVLPKMNECIASPTLQGCSVILPKLEQCAVNPNQEGCEAVLPKPDFCGTHPLDPRCAVFNPGAGSSGNGEKAPVAKAVQTTVDLINNRTSTRPAGAGSGAGAGPGGTAGAGTGTGSGNANDSSGPDKPSEKQGGPAASDNGAKNEKPATKLYCN